MDWDMFRIASDNNIDAYADSVSKCIGDVVPSVTIKTLPKRKPWNDGSIHAN
jgi:hypothetical protein